MRARRFTLLGLLGLTGSLCLVSPVFSGEPCDYPQCFSWLEHGGTIKFPADVAVDPEGHADYFEWIKRFRYCLVRSPQYFEEPYLTELHRAGCQLFIRLPFGRINVGEAPVHTGKEPRSGRARAFAEICAHREWLLNPDMPVRRRANAPPAYFFDFNNEDFRRFHVGWLKRQLEETGYDGVYFDIMGGYGVPDRLMEVWKQKYPNTSYDEAGGRFVRELREAVGHKLIGGNMAYRGWQYYFPHIDYSHKESHGTSHRGAKEVVIHLDDAGRRRVRETFYRPWDGPGGYKELNAPRRTAEKNYPRVHTCDLNYIFPRCVLTGTVREVDGQTVPVFTREPDRPAIFYGYALAKLSGRGFYASELSSLTVDTIEEWTPKFVQDDVYFVDLGPPLEDDYREMEEVVVRYFRRGFVAVTRHNRHVRFEANAEMIPEDAAGLWDLYEREEVRDWRSGHSVTIGPAYYPATGSYYPSGRVYLYVD